MIRSGLGEAYSPLFFLAALGAGGVAVTFFVHLTFTIPHPETPVVTFGHLWPMVLAGSAYTQVLVGAAVAGMALFTLLHLRLLAWNLLEYRRFRGTAAYRQLLTGNGEVTLMTLPLTLAMSINVLFVNAAVLVPGLWQVVEYLFPLAVVGFLAVGYLALRLYTRYFTRVIAGGNFDFGDNNNLGQMVAIFAFAMIGVGLAAPGAMSHHLEINAVGIFGAIFFMTIAVTLGMLKFVMGFKSMLSHGVAPAGGPSLWIVIPILTLLGIALIRVNFGLAHGFDEPVSTPGLYVLTSAIFSLQILFGILGYTVMKRVGYFRDYLHGEQRHPGSYALICPGVAFFVFGMFFIHFGLVKNGLVDAFSPVYFAALVPLVYIQFKTIVTLFRLNRRLLKMPRRIGDAALDPA
jgi:hypothetical protein